MLGQKHMTANKSFEFTSLYAPKLKLNVMSERMKRLPLVLTVALIAGSSLSETNLIHRGGVTLDDLRPLAASVGPLIGNDRTGLRQLAKIEPMESKRLKALFPKHTFWRTIASDPGDRFFHAAYIDCLVLNDGKPEYLDSDLKVAWFIQDKGIDIHKARDALDLVHAFAELRNYTLTQKRPEGKNALLKKKDPRKPKPDDWDLKIESDGSSWDISCAFLTSIHGRAYVKYTFGLHPNGSFAVEATETVFIRHFVR